MGNISIDDLNRKAETILKNEYNIHGIIVSLDPESKLSGMDLINSFLEQMKELRNVF